MRQNENGSIVVTDPEVTARACRDLYSRARTEQDDPPVVLGAIAEEHYRIALAALETARAHFTLAHVHAMRRD